MRVRWIGVAVAALLLVALPKPAAAQETRADTAAVLVAAARRLAAVGERDIAANLLRYIIRWYGDTPIAQDAARELASTDRARAAGGGRIGFVVTNTLFGAWMGLAIPLAFEADDPTPYGVGLIAGPGVGLLGSLLYTKSYPITSGQTAAYRWSLIWLSWQAYMLQELTGIGLDRTCAPDGFGGEYCYDGASEGARFGALIVGGAAGIGAGLALTRLHLPAGDVALVQDASAWGTALGAALSVLTSSDGHPDEGAVFGWMTALGNGALVGAIPLARAWRPSVGRVRLITISGIAGSLVGLGLDLIADVDDDKAVVAIPTLGAAVGLATGVLLTAGRDVGATGAQAPLDDRALVQLGRNSGLGVPLPEPRTVPALSRDGQLGRQPAVGFRIAELRF